jgi:O-antigen/teichoic acid export membrane protein
VEQDQPSVEPPPGQASATQEPSAGQGSNAPWWRRLPGLHRYVRPGTLFYRLMSNASWLIGEKVVTLGLRFLVSVWVVRYLGPELYGVYSYAMSLVFLLGAFASLGLDSIMIRQLTRGRHPERTVLATGWVMRAGAGLVVFGLLAAFVMQTEERALTQVVVLLVGGQLVLQAFKVFDLWFQARILSRYAVWVRTAAVVVYAGAQIVFVVTDRPVTWFAALVTGYVALQMVGFLGAYLRVSRTTGAATDEGATTKDEAAKEAAAKDEAAKDEAVAGPWRVQPSLAGEMMRDAWPLILSSLSVSIYLKIDQVMLSHMVGDAAVGVYATAVKLSELWYFIPMAVAGSVFPVIVRMRDRADVATYQARMQTLYDLMALLSYAVVLPVTLVAGPLVMWLFGDSYAAAGDVLRVHIWAFLFASLGTAWGRWMIAENRMRLFMVSTAASAVVNVGLNLVVVPRFAEVGAAWTTLASQVAAAYGASLVVPVLRPAFRQMSKAIAVPLRLPEVLRAVRHLADPSARADEAAASGPAAAPPAAAPPETSNGTSTSPSGPEEGGATPPGDAAS